MAVNPIIPEEKENAAIDTNISMTVEEILPRFLQNRTRTALYDRKTTFGGTARRPSRRCI